MPEEWPGSSGFAKRNLARVAWYPPSYTGSDVVRVGFVGIGVNAALNIAREFAPELLRLVPFR